MRQTPWIKAETYRRQHPFGNAPYGSDYGYFEITGPCGMTLRCIVTAGIPNEIDEISKWEHVSVSLPNRCPNWREMHFIKEIFWNDDEAVMQLHPPKRDYVNLHPYCLHMWRPTHKEIPLPPSILVGPDTAKVEKDE